MRVRDIMYPFPSTLKDSATVLEAKTLLSERGIHYALIVRDGEVLGLTCACDLAQAPVNDSAALHAHPKMMAIDMNDTAVLAARLISLCGSGCLVVLDSSARLRGIVTRADLQETGLLPSVRGLDLCASCGSNEHLLAKSSDEVARCCACIGDTTVAVLAKPRSVSATVSRESR